MSSDVKPGYYVSHPEKIGEFHLLEAAKSPNPEIAVLAINQLLLQNEPFLKLYIKKWLRSPLYDFEYLLQEARIAFFNAIADYDISLGISIRAYSKFHLMRLGRELFKKRRITLVENINELPESVHIPDYAEESFNLQKVLGTAMKSCLTETERRVIHQHYFLGLKQKDIAAQSDRTPVRINTILSTAYTKLKRHLIAKGIKPGFLHFN